MACGLKLDGTSVCSVGMRLLIRCDMGRKAWHAPNYWMACGWDSASMLLEIGWDVGG